MGTTRRLRWLLVHPVFLPAVAVVGIALRLVIVAKLGGAMNFFDEHDYDRLGEALAGGRGFVNEGAVTAFRPPGEPLFLAGVYALIGHRPELAEAIQAVLLGCVPYAVARMARRLGLAVCWANSAGALASLHPGLAYASATLYPTALTAVTLTLGAMLAADAVETASLRQGTGAAVFLGMTGALTTTFVPMAVLVAVAAGLCRRWSVALLIGCLGFVPAAAWMVRNDIALGAPVLATNGAYNLALGANDEATPRSGNWVDVELPPEYADRGELARDRAFREVAVAWIEGHKLRYAALALGRTAATLDSVGRPKTAGEHNALGARLVGYAMLPWVGLGVMGLVMRWRSSTAWIAGAGLACVVFASALTIAKPRFRFPCDPALAVFAAAVAERAWRRRSSRGGRKVLP